MAQSKGLIVGPVCEGKANHGLRELPEKGSRILLMQLVCVPAVPSYAYQLRK